MKVDLRHATPLYEAVNGARTCYSSQDKSDSIIFEFGIRVDEIGQKDQALLSKLTEKHHESVIEHVNYTFHVFGPSRATLQEVARHRTASLSVESSRYVWKRLKKLALGDGTHSIYDWEDNQKEIAKLMVKTDPVLDKIEQAYVTNLIEAISRHNLKPDVFKHKFPESMKTNFVMTINARSLRNFFKQRLPRSAMWEIRKLAVLMWEQLPPQDMGCLFGDLRSLYERAAQDITKHSTQALYQGADKTLQ